MRDAALALMQIRGIHSVMFALRILMEYDTPRLEHISGCQNSSAMVQRGVRSLGRSQ